jgi:hypothetical protein
MRSRVRWWQRATPVSESQIRLTGGRGTYATAIALARRKLPEKLLPKDFNEAKDRKLEAATSSTSAKRATTGTGEYHMRFLIGCILGLAALTPLAIVAARAVAVPTLPTNLVVASADARICTPYNGPFGYYGNPW